MSPAVANDAPVSHTNTSLDWLFDTPPSPANKAAKAPPLVDLTLSSVYYLLWKLLLTSLCLTFKGQCEEDN